MKERIRRKRRSRRSDTVPRGSGGLPGRKAHRRPESVAAANNPPGAVATGITSVTAVNVAQVVGSEGLTPEALGALERGPGLGAEHPSEIDIDQAAVSADELVHNAFLSCSQTD